MKAIIQFSILFIFGSFHFLKTDKLVLCNQVAESGYKTKLVKDLTEEEFCAYRILKKIIENESENKEKITFFSKVQIIKKDGLFQISTNANTTLKGFKSPSGSTVVNYDLILKNRIVHEITLPDDSIVIKHFVSYKPEYRIGRKAMCSKYEWEIYNTGSRYLTGLIVDADFIIKNEHEYQYISYVDTHYAIVKKNNRFGLVNRDGKVLLPIIYDYMIRNDFGLLIKEKDIYYYLNPVTGKKLSKNYVNVNVAAMYNLKQKLFPVTRNNKMTLLNSKFEEIVPLIYDNFTTRGLGKNKIILGHRENQWLIIDSQTGKESGKYTIE